MSVDTLNVIINYVYLIAASIAILIAGFIVGVIVKKLLYVLLKEIQFNELMKKAGMNSNFESIISYLAMYSIDLFTIILSLNQLGLATIVIWIVLGGIAILVLLSLLLGIREIIPNLKGWNTIRKNKDYREGKEIEINHIKGIIEYKGYLETIIRTEMDDLLYLPNSLFINKDLKNEKA